MRVKGFLINGDNITISLDKHQIPAKVTGVNGNIVTVAFDEITDEELNYILNLTSFQTL
jgi:hypothetical protein